MLWTRILLREMVLAVGVMTVGTGPLSAQAPPDGGAPPFFPKGLAENPDKFFEQMFGGSTPEEDESLDKEQISLREEREFGQPQVEAFLAQLSEQGLAVTRKGRDVEYFKRLVETIRPFMSHAKRYDRLTIYVVDSPRIDARSFAGGTLFFFKGLLAEARNEAALVGMVGHELSHLDRGHVLLPLRRARVMERTLADGTTAFDPQRFFAATTTTMRLMSRPFRPEDESAADRDGAAWAWRAGYDPREMAALFERLHQRDSDPKLPFASFFRTHPYSDDRAAAILRQFDELEQQDPQKTLYRGRENLARRTPKSQQQYPE
jgi:predicted Zn-dependent protease